MLYAQRGLIRALGGSHKRGRNIMAHVFISYVRENNDQVLRLRTGLMEAGVEVWLDRDSIKPGARWRDAIQGAIRGGDFFIACFSREYEEKIKSYMNEELTLAIEELRQYPTTRAWFIPVILNDCTIPARSIGAGETLLAIQWVDLREDWNNGLSKIISVIKPTPVEVQKLLSYLESNDDDIRQRAVIALQDIADPVAERALKSALNDSSQKVRVAAIYALLSKEEIGVRYICDVIESRAETEVAESLASKLIDILVEDHFADQAADALIQVFRTGTHQLKIWIMHWLANMASNYRYEYDVLLSEVNYFEGAIGKYPYFQDKALSALDRHSVPLLCEALNSSDERIIRLARETLKAIGKDNARECLKLSQKSPE